MSARTGTPKGKPPAHKFAALKQAQMTNVPSRSNDNVLASLRATAIVDSKPVLPAELLATILDYVPVPDLVRCARVSRRLHEMVYDDSRWQQRLRAMGVWNESEAKQRQEALVRRKVEARRSKEVEEKERTGVGVNGTGRRHAGSVTLFDAGFEEERYKRSVEVEGKSRRKETLSDGFDNAVPSQEPSRSWDLMSALAAFENVRSIRGHAKEEFAKIYGALGPLYQDLDRSKGHSDSLVFRTYRDPEQQAQVLANLKRFARCDDSQGWERREERLDTMMGVFENAVLQEFRHGYIDSDVDGRMRRYAQVLVTLNGGAAVIDSFITSHPIMQRTLRLGKPLDCLEGCAPGHVDLNASQRFFEGIAGVLVDQATVIDTIFPSADVLTPFLSRICEEVMSDYLTTLFDETHSRSVDAYVKAVSGTFGQAMRLTASLQPTKATPPDFREQSKSTVLQCFDKHVDLYLKEELDVFKNKSTAEVGQWEKQLSEQEASTESFFMSNVNRQAAKRDFLSSFKKVVMMPVNIMPAFGTTKPVVNAANRSSAVVDSEGSGTRTSTPSLNGSGAGNRASTPLPEAPTTELAAKAAIMNSRLEGIKTLFSVEVALNLTHLAKASLERAAIFVQMGDKPGTSAKEQCEAIFCNLLTILGGRHIKTGFDKAVEHLGSYNPREVRQFRSHPNGNGTEHSGQAIGVEPLVTFLELVNLGDLIQQMVDVFYAQELVSTKLTDRDDFLDPAVKEKKRFEQMLDERVAAGLNKGIDVLITEVEYICATTQKPTDFNPTSQSSGLDIGPSLTAQQVVDTVSGHTNMLVGSTDKNMLDVFTQEVGLRLFGALCKHFKRQRISIDGAIKLIADINHYASFVNTLRQKQLVPYFSALRELGQIYLVHIEPPGNMFGGGGKRGSVLSTKQSESAKQAKELAAIIADTQRYRGIFAAEEVYEFAERRADWYLVKGDVERAMYGVGCVVM
ncbi:hypothetical protein MBLNU230_g6116t1 [Neophaeotheca triangularis]